MPAAISSTPIASFALSRMVDDGSFKRLLASSRVVRWQGQRASNPQPSVLETDALPIELCPYENKTCANAKPEPLLDDLRDDAGADGLAALADGEAKPLLHRHRRDQRHHHLHVVPGHHHLRALGQLHRP